MRVGLLVRFAQTFRADVRVDLGRGQAFVAQQFLHAAQVGSVVEQVRGKAVSERVRAGAQRAPGRSRPARSGAGFR